MISVNQEIETSVPEKLNKEGGGWGGGGVARDT